MLDGTTASTMKLGASLGSGALTFAAGQGAINNTITYAVDTKMKLETSPGSSNGAISITGGAINNQMTYLQTIPVPPGKEASVGITVTTESEGPQDELHQTYDYSKYGESVGISPR